jgi:hypothetical protein
MARIERKHHNNFVRRKTNHSFVQSEYYYLSGTSVSASTQYGPAIHVYNVDDLTMKQNKPRVDPETLQFNDNRRPYFEDQFTWTKTRLELSAYDNVKYYGSGTLATDEVSAYFRGNGIPLQKPDNVTAGGKIAAEEILWTDYSGWHDDISDSDYGNQVYTLTGPDGTHTIKISQGLGGFIDRWNFKPSGATSNADSITLIHDGNGFGRQSYGDQQYIERLGGWYDPLLAPYNTILKPNNLERPVGLTEDYPTYSGVEFYPPIPKRYINPIPDAGVSTYDRERGVTDACNYFPEYFLTRGNIAALPFYSKITEGDNNKVTLDAAGFMVDYSSEQKGGDTFSSLAVLANGTFFKTFSQLWDSNSTSLVNPTSGFLETWANQSEAGYIPNTRPLPMAFLLYTKNEINHGGPGVHRQVIAEFRNHNFGYENYLDRKVYNRSTAVELEESIAKQYISSIGELNKLTPVLPLYGSNINSMFTNFTDIRFDNMYLYSPETKKSISFNDTTASKYRYNNVLYDLEDVYYFNNLPVIPNPVGITRSIIDYRYAAGATSPALILTQTAGSGPINDPVEVKYERVIEPDDPEWLGSNKVLSIYERSSNAPGNLMSQAVGFYVVLDSDRVASLGKSDYLRPDNVIMSTLNGLTSGVNGFKNVSAAHASMFEENKFESIEGNRINLAPIEGSPWQAISTACPQVPKGWVARHFLRIHGSDKDDVINKLENYLANNTFPETINAKDELPETLLNYDHPLKCGKIH